MRSEGGPRPSRFSLEVAGLIRGQPGHLSFLRAGTGRRVLLLHGFASDANDDWIATGWFDALVASGYDVVAPDLRGHGLTDKSRDPTDYRLEAFVADMLTLSKECWDEETFDVVGYSMGAHVAMALALKLPDRIVCLVLGGMGDRIATSVGLAPEYADALDRGNGTGRAADGRDLPSYAVRLSQYAASRPRNDLEALAACLRGQTCVFDLTRLAIIKAPTLVMVGGDDKLAGSSHHVAALFAGGTGVTLPGLNHASALADEAFRSRAIMHLDAAAMSTVEER